MQRFVPCKAKETPLCGKSSRGTFWIQKIGRWKIVDRKNPSTSRLICSCNFRLRIKSSSQGHIWGQRVTVRDIQNNPKMPLFWLKEPKRGTLHHFRECVDESPWWKSGSIFRLEVRAVWCWFSCAVDFHLQQWSLYGNTSLSSWKSIDLRQSFLVMDSRLDTKKMILGWVKKTTETDSPRPRLIVSENGI